MGLLAEFKTFAMRGNVIDLAVGVVIGAAFGKIVSSLVDGIIMPLVGMVVGGVDFSELAVELKPKVLDAAGTTLYESSAVDTRLRTSRDRVAIPGPGPGSIRSPRSADTWRRRPARRRWRGSSPSHPRSARRRTGSNSGPPPKG